MQANSDMWQKYKRRNWNLLKINYLLYDILILSNTYNTILAETEWDLCRHDGS